MHDGILILPNHVFFIGGLACFQTTLCFYGLGKTWLDTKFHLHKSRNKVLVHNGILILPQYVSFIGKLALKQPANFTSLRNMAGDKVSRT